MIKLQPLRTRLVRQIASYNIYHVLTTLYGLASDLFKRKKPTQNATTPPPEPSRSEKKTSRSRPDASRSDATLHSRRLTMTNSASKREALARYSGCDNPPPSRMITKPKGRPMYDWPLEMEMDVNRTIQVSRAQLHPESLLPTENSGPCR